MSDILSDIDEKELTTFKSSELQKLPRAMRRRIQKDLLKRGAVNIVDRIKEMELCTLRAQQQAKFDVQTAKIEAHAEVARIKEKTSALETRIIQLRRVCDNNTLSPMQKLEMLESGIRHSFYFPDSTF